MAHMELQFPADAQEEAVYSGRNLSDTEKWLSIAAGTGLALYGISRRNKQGWLMTAIGGMLLQRGTTGHCHLYEALGLNTAGTGDDTRRALGGASGVLVDESVTINRPVEELYRFWRNLENLPQFMTPPRIGRAHHRHVVTLAGRGAGRSPGRVDGRDHQRSAEQGDRLALARRLRRRHAPARSTSTTRVRAGDTSARAPSVQPARRQNRGGRRQTVRPRCCH